MMSFHEGWLAAGLAAVEAFAFEATLVAAAAFEVVAFLAAVAFAAAVFVVAALGLEVLVVVVVVAAIVMRKGVDVEGCGETWVRGRIS